ncbi:multiple sugar transport system substrate-binding protein [Lipingzhangella halophila]|uniref:Multiple sugar transport system substrate-binding protein n=1 Tax=Lipingzhangella halophila TaxID=1783352 RepID=A0A7W7RJY2_9ACTN|nr:extracellular solute-binding protein [Lipingzhangella halophila]MBB4933362.1 multiple sugar transport system substrate-binding protein [Lipingzhangella halophila]
MHTKPANGTRRLRAPSALMAAGLLTLGTACSASDDGDVTTLTSIDYNLAEPQNGSTQAMLDECGEQAGVEIERDAQPRDQLMPSLLQGASQQELPDLMLIDNPDLPQVAATGALLPLEEAGVDTDGFYDSALEIGRHDDTLYGITAGVNGLALFTNTAMLEDADVDPPATWEELSDAADELTEGDTSGYAFSAIGHEEGTFNFEPFLWSNGGSLTELDSPEAVEALDFWSRMVEDGSVSQSVVNWSQADVNDQFLGEHVAMMVNGSWQIPVLDEEGLEYGVSPLPVPESGDDPATPMGGEVWAVAQNGGEREELAVEVLQCLLGDDNLTEWAELNAYVPAKEDLADQMAEDNPEMAPFVESVPTAQSRTAELGEDYPEVSGAIADAIQEALAGSGSAEEALGQAQQSVPTS